MTASVPEARDASADRPVNEFTLRAWPGAIARRMTDDAGEGRVGRFVGVLCIAVRSQIPGGMGSPTNATAIP